MTLELPVTDARLVSGPRPAGLGQLAREKRLAQVLRAGDIRMCGSAVRRSVTCSTSLGAGHARAVTLFSLAPGLGLYAASPASRMQDPIANREWLSGYAKDFGFT